MDAIVKTTAKKAEFKDRWDALDVVTDEEIQETLSKRNVLIKTIVYLINIPHQIFVLSKRFVVAIIAGIRKKVKK